jgi:hypothetical protein
VDQKLSTLEEEEDGKEHYTHQQNLEDRMDFGSRIGLGRQILLRQGRWDCCVVVHGVAQS